MIPVTKITRDNNFAFFWNGTEIKAVFRATDRWQILIDKTDKPFILVTSDPALSNQPTNPGAVPGFSQYQIMFSVELITEIDNGTDPAWTRTALDVSPGSAWQTYYQTRFYEVVQELASTIFNGCCSDTIIVSGGAIVWVDTYADLPATGLEGVLYIVKDTGDCYRWEPAASESDYVYVSKDVLPFLTLASFPLTGIEAKIYIDLSTGKGYRWEPAASESDYVEIFNDVLEYESIVDFPAIGIEGFIYVDKTTNKIYRWEDAASEMDYVELSPGASSSVNIYNTDGTLTATRTLDGAAFLYALQFVDLSSFAAVAGDGVDISVNLLLDPGGSSSIQYSDTGTGVNSYFSAAASSSVVSYTDSGANTHQITLQNGQLIIDEPTLFRLMTPDVNASTAVAGMYLKLISAATGEAEYDYVPLEWTCGMAGDTMGASTTAYYSVKSNTAGDNGTESVRQTTAGFACVIRKIYVSIRTAQPASGSIVFTFRVNGVDTAAVLTIAAGSAAGTYSASGFTVAVAAGDLVSMKGVNNATAASAGIQDITTTGTYS